MPAGPVRPPKAVRPWHPAPTTGTSVWSRIQSWVPLLKASTWTGTSTTGRDPVAAGIAGWQSQQAALNRAKNALVVVSPPRVSGPGGLYHAPSPRLAPRGGGKPPVIRPPRLRPKPKAKAAVKPIPPQPAAVVPAAAVKPIPPQPAYRPPASGGGPWYPPAPAVVVAAPSAASPGIGAGTMLLLGGAIAGVVLLARKKAKK